MEDKLHFKRIYTQTIETEWLQAKHVLLHVLRLDCIHPVISGNKWFKLKYHLSKAAAEGYNTITTAGGAYSNHIAATAFACRTAGIHAIGMIRGERPPVLSPTLERAMADGMQLEFISRNLFRDKTILQQAFPQSYFIPEGGYSTEGAMGAMEITGYCSDPEQYTHLVCAVGTGTMMAGLVRAATNNQKVIGISVMRGNTALKQQVAALLGPEDLGKDYSIEQGYHFGGYAKHPPELLQFMNDTWNTWQLPTDIVYTSKTLFAIFDMLKNKRLPPRSKILMIHSGGLQGNLSLGDGVLLF